MSVWYHAIPIASVREGVALTLRAAGFTFDDLPLEFHSWDRVRYGAHRVWCSISSRTEDHVVFELKAAILLDDLPGTFLRVFDALLSALQGPPAECILSASNPEVYPFFTHSFSRSSTPPVIVDLDLAIAVNHRPADDGYWEIAGRALHFVSSATLVRTSAPAPEAWARRIRAACLTMEAGVVFDCGWTSTWPVLASLRRM